MDYSNVETGIFDTLEILRPLVKRNLWKSNNTIGVNTNTRTYIRKEIIKCNKPRKLRGPTETSTSLLLRETAEKQVLEQYSVVNHTSVQAHTEQFRPIPITNHSIYKEKPLIQVTVIRKTEQLQPGKLFKRRRHYLQNSVSNQEKFLNSKNIYAVAVGNKKEHIHEIKASGSATFPNKGTNREIKHEKDISDCKQILESLNMDIKKKRDKKTKKLNNFEEHEDVCERCYDCGCWENVRNEIHTDLKEHKSRVRIYGRVGLAQNDRYVVDYTATVDGKPMHDVIYTPVEHNSEVSSIFLAHDDQPRFMRNINKVGCVCEAVNNDNNNGRCQRDCYVQTDIRDSETAGSPFELNQPWIGKESQGTQVNFSLALQNPNNAKHYQTKNQKIQREHQNLNNTKNQGELKNRVEECQSPLVIISVYPKHDSTDLIKTMTCNKSANTAATFPKKPSILRSRAVSPKRNTEKSLQTVKAISPSRSPSPENNTRQKRQVKKKDYEPKFNKAKRSSPNYETSQKVVTKIEPKNIITNKVNSPHRREATWHQMIKRDGEPSVQKKTEQMLAKRALVDDFTKRITESMEKPAITRNALKNGTSKVIVNIDSENEHYDVLFEQGNLTTDLTVRRNRKGSPRRVYEQLDISRPPPPVSFKKEPKNWTNYVDKTQINNEHHKQNQSRLNVRDSLEIPHRRDNDQITNVIKTQTLKRRTAKKVDNYFLAPIKHYKGDNCNLPNPIERDKQIRELLGIETHIPYTTETRQYQDYIVDSNEEGYLQCIMQKSNKHLPMNLYRHLNCRHFTCDCRRRDSPKEVVSPDDVYTEDQNNATKSIKDNSTQYDLGPVERNLYQQLILNRNIQVFLQVEQFNKQKPIILSRQQYDKVKRTIQDTINRKGVKNNRSKVNKCACKCSIVSVGNVREKTKSEVTERMEKGVQASKANINNHDGRQTSKKLHWLKKNKEHKKSPTKGVHTLVLFNSNEANVSNLGNKGSKDTNIKSLRQTVSSIDMKHEEFSRTNLKSETTSHLGQSRSYSLITIYKVSGRKKSLTPNLGTSIISDGVSDSKSVKSLMRPRDVKSKKPFLQRLISYLVNTNRSTRGSLKLTNRPVPFTTSVNSSNDSYRISSSLGGIEITSSLYDTSASFYTNHSILQVSNKMKRGFFSSVREFLINCKR